MFTLNTSFPKPHWFFIVLVHRNDNLALFLYLFIEMHTEKSKQFICGPVVHGILSTKEKFNCLENDFWK